MSEFFNSFTSLHIGSRLLWISGLRGGLITVAVLLPLLQRERFWAEAELRMVETRVEYLQAVSGSKLRHADFSGLKHTHRQVCIQSWLIGYTCKY
jgi:hypothetical protein